ncbi:MAG: hypothetical protein EZS28_046206, partial [Streblomastix strix]
ARACEGDGLQQAPLVDDLQLSPQETLASPFSLPIISTQSIVEAESPNDHESAKVKKSQMQNDGQDDELIIKIPPFIKQSVNIQQLQAYFFTRSQTALSIGT